MKNDKETRSQVIYNTMYILLLFIVLKVNIDPNEAPEKQP